MPQAVTALTRGPASCAGPAGFEQEWLVTDGLGGFAMGTVAGLRTRRYHALLVTPPAGALDGQPRPAGAVGTRQVALVALDPVLTLPSGATIRLATHEWASGAIDPRGHELLECFELVDGVPGWSFRIGDIVLRRELAMAHGQNAVGVVHRLCAGPDGVRLTLTALGTWRDANGERFAGEHLPMRPVADGVEVCEAYRLRGPNFTAAGGWYLGAHTRIEAERGFTSLEDLFAIGTFTDVLNPGQELSVCAWTGALDQPPPPAAALVDAARKRARRLARAAKPVDQAGATLALAADAFVVRTAAGPDIVAGYPWFGAYPRDTMTAYEGLLLHTGRADEGRELLLARAPGAVEDGPPGAAAGEPDAALWFVHALHRHVAVTGDTDLAATLLPRAEGVLTRYTQGSSGVCVDPADGLLAIELDRTGRTWMNACLPGGPVTPRDGKPIELNALWCNALGALAELRERLGQPDTGLLARYDAVRAQVAKRYPAPEGWLYDVLDGQPGAYPLGGDGGHDDPVLRPNQVFAFALPFAPCDPTDSPALRAVGRHLLTPVGLRTLAPAEIGYHGAYRGAAADRESAYHQGAVWPWLLGSYVTALASAGDPDGSAIARVSGLLAGLHAHLGEAGLGSVSELLDGDPPHRARGCPFSARSVAELIRARAVLFGQRASHVVHRNVAREQGPARRRRAIG